jgi:hypothetical protein
LAAAPSKDTTPRKPRMSSKKDESKQIDLEEAIAEKAAKELNDDISDVGVEPETGGEDDKPVSKDDVRTKLIALMKAQGEESVPALLKNFGASKIGELKEDQYAAVVQKADEIINGDD